IRRRLTWNGMFTSILETGINTSAIFLLVIGGFLFSRFISVSGAIHSFSAIIMGLGINRMLVFAFVCLLYIFLGCFLESISSMAVTLAMIFPLMTSLGFDGIWFGVVLVLLLELGMITPPVGLNVYVVHSSAGGAVELGDVFRGILPLLPAVLLALVILTAFPQIALFLPNTMF
ncbi:TRAP transporter large permease subunit, partial [Chloroflexota bacterium]